MACISRIVAVAGGVLVVIMAHGAEGGGTEVDGANVFGRLEEEYSSRVRPLLERFCLDCHSTEEMKGELDLERFSALKDVRRDPAAWQKVIEMLDDGEMPPKKRRQPSSDEKKLLRNWARRYLDAEALASAGDPGPVVLRRLSNSEYTYTIRDLTGIEELDPAREFPVDGAAGEGFTNSGNALVMSPALISKYLDAGKEIAKHAVLLPDGMRFSRGDSRRDWSAEILSEIRALYVRHTSGDGSMNVLNKWNPNDARTSTLGDGRVDLTRYWNALIVHRDEVSAGTADLAAIAAKERLSAKYLGHIAHMLTRERTEPSPLLDELRQRWRRASPGAGEAVAAEIRAWQNRLWRFNLVGHLGLVRPWQEPASPLVSSRNFGVKIDPPTSGEELSIVLRSGTAGDSSKADVVEWRRPRIVRSGKPDILLRDVRAGVAVLFRQREQILVRTAEYLSAVFEARQDSEADLASLARQHDLDAGMLRAWVNYLGISTGGQVAIKEPMRHRLERVGGYDFAKGWGLRGVGDLSLVSNSSDQKVNIPGELNPHRVVVHPRPERWVAAGWMSPIDGQVDVEVHVQDAHACGNGVSWSLDLRRGPRRRVLGSGNVNIREKANAEPVRGLAVRKGDLISLVIGARDGNHACDLTEIDLSIKGREGEEQSWALAADCADTIGEGNPHADRHGNSGIWHFYTGLNDGSEAAPPIPAGSLLARWLDSNGREEAARLAAAIRDLVTKPLTKTASRSDAEPWNDLTSPTGEL